jgi:murein DD-endopeptidase MepM/ murein hydrolase activator NlpD
MNERFYLMFADNIAGRFRHFSLPKYAVKGFFALIGVIFVLSIFLIYRYIGLSRDVIELQGLRKETREQRLQIRQFIHKVKDFEQQMVRLEKFDKKLRVITSLERDGSSVRKWGVGGPNHEEIDIYDPILPSKGEDVIEELEKDINELNNQAKFQEISFQELDEFFKGQESLLSSTPSIWPVRGWVTSGFGYRVSPFTNMKEVHDGIDVATRMNAPVISPADGIIVRVGNDISYGNILEIDHGYGVVTRYGHNSRILVNMGDMVKRGQVVAEVGNTGRSTGPHLHYEVFMKGIPVNPLNYIFD